MTTREKRKEDLKDDVKHLLEDLRDAEEGETFYKMFTREHAKGMHKVMRHYK